MQKFFKKLKNKLAGYWCQVPFFAFKRKKRYLAPILICVMLGIGAFFYFSHNQVRAAWYSSSYSYRKKLTFNNSSYGALTDQPVSIELTSANFDFGKARSDGYDIVFTDSDGTTLLTYTREIFSAGSESARFWVKVPAIEANVNTDFIYMYYGNASAGNTSSAFANSFFSGAAGYWGMEDGNRSEVTDTVAESVADEDMLAITPTGTIDSTTGVRGNALTFNGTDEYLTQKVWDTKQGTVTASMASGVGFINDDTQDFTPYIGASGSSKPYMIVVTDSAGKKAWGYIGEQGTGETLGGEVAVNSWTNNPSYIYETFTVGTGNTITQAVNSSGESVYGIASNSTAVATIGILYKCTNTLVVSSGVTPSIDWCSAGSYWDGQSFQVNTTSYQTIKNDGISRSRLQLLVGEPTNFALTALSIKQVLTPTTSGVKIYSTKTGSTQSWANVEDGFNANSVSSYEIRKTDFQITGAVTVGAWVKTSDTSGTIISKWNDGDVTKRAWRIMLNTPNFLFAFYDGSGASKTLDAGQSISDNNWHFVNAVADGSYLRTYIDGASVGTPVSYNGAVRDVNTTFTIDNQVNGDFLVNGSIDEPIILPSALSADQIGAYYNNTKEAQDYVSFGDQTTRGEVESGSAGLLPLAHWKFNDGQGATAQDATANNNDGTITGAGYWTSEENCVQGKCVYLDGTNDWVSRAYDGDFNFGTSPFTASGWFKSDLVSSTKIIASRYSSGGWKMYLNSSGNVCFGVDDDAVWEPDDPACSSARYDDNEWHFVSAIRDTSRIDVYVDATSAGSDVALSATGTLSGSSPVLYLGIDSDGTSNKFTGYLDDFKIYPYARSATQIAEDYNAPGLPRGAATKGISFSFGGTISGYKYRKKLTFANTSYGALTNQPVSVVLSSSNFDFTKTRSDGYDIIFTDSNGTTLLNFNREAYSAGSESARFWVKVPQIDAASATDYIYMYYGNGSASDRSVAFSNAFFSGAAGYWGMEDGNRSEVTDTVAESVADEDMLAVTPTGTIDSATGVRGNALTFNGTDEYLTQKVWDTKQGTVTASVADTVGFINDDGQDFTPYVGASGSSKPYMIVVTDSAGKKAWGYIGEQGTGETLGGELVQTWLAPYLLFDTFTTSESNITSAVHITTGDGAQCHNQLSSAQSIGSLLKIIYNVTINSGQIQEFSLGSSVFSEVPKQYIWSNKVSSISDIAYITTTGAAQKYLSYWTTLLVNFSTADDSVKQVLTPTTNGVKIYSTKTGTTQSWANVESGFNANSVSSYEIRKTDFQITGAVTVGAWVKTSSASGRIISKFDTNSIRAFELGLNSSKHVTATFSTNGTSDTASVDGTVDIADNTYHFISAVFNPSTYLKTYVDGVEAASNTTSIPATIYDSRVPFVIGGRFATGVLSTPHNGSIDEPIILPSALSADQIGAYYNNTKASQDYVGFGAEEGLEGGGGIEGAVGGVDLTTGLVGEWKFDEKSGTSAADSSGNGNTGTLTNGPVWVGGKMGGGVQMDGVDDYVGVTDF